jgi:hypothetical protein
MRGFPPIPHRPRRPSLLPRSGAIALTVGGDDPTVITDWNALAVAILAADITKPAVA